VRPAPRLLLLAVVSAMSLSACAADGRDEVGELRAELVARSEAENDLAARVELLEEELAAVGTDVTTATRLDGLEDHLARLDATLTVLDDRLEDEARTRQAASEDGELATADLRDTFAALQGTLDELRGETAELRGETDELRTLYETLRDRLDRQQLDRPQPD
jgi:chromosome segregation ATPase